MPVTHPDVFAINLEVTHRVVRIAEVHGEIAVNIVTAFLHIEELGLHAGIMELVMNLAEFVKELIPFLAIIGEETAFLVFLRDAENSLNIRVFPAIEIAEISL